MSVSKISFITCLIEGDLLTLPKDKESYDALKKKDFDTLTSEAFSNFFHKYQGKIQTIGPKEIDLEEVSRAVSDFKKALDQEEEIIEEGIYSNPKGTVSLFYKKSIIFTIRSGVEIGGQLILEREGEAQAYKISQEVLNNRHSFKVFFTFFQKHRGEIKVIGQKKLNLKKLNQTVNKLKKLLDQGIKEKIYSNWKDAIHLCYKPMYTERE